MLSMRNQKKFLPCISSVGLENYFIIKDHTTRYHFGKNRKKGIKNELQLL